MAARCKASGCTGFLTKPIRKAGLLAELAKYCGDMDCPETDFDLPPEIEALVPQYLEGRVQDLQSLADALAERDYETIRIIGHNLKGTGGAYGFPELTAAGELIESAAKSRDDDAIRLSLGDIERAVHKTVVTAS